MTLPALFVSHGSPMTALRPGEAGAALARFAQQWPTPRAVLIVSPHWHRRELALSSRDPQVAWHDFSGFDPALYTLRYAPPGAPDVAAHAQAALARAGIAATLDAQRPLDHGMWVPLRWMYPHADVPVVAMSLLADAHADTQLRIGRALAPLRAEGVLVVGSGSFTHNLHEFSPAASVDAAPQPYVDAFRGWMIDALERADLPALMRWRTSAPDAVRAHPTDEHLMPLFFALGAAGDAVGRVVRLTDETTYGMLAMDAFTFGGAAD